MSFHTYDYLCFFAAVFSIYWLLPRKGQNVFLLLGSYHFYGYIHPWFLYLILTSTLVDYWCGLGMKRFPNRRTVLLVISLSANLGLLGVFKYFNFFLENIQAILALVGLPNFGRFLHVYLPVGISFYTFQTLSYTIDIYRGRLEPRKNFVDFAVFVAFFPQLVAGPIERARRLLPQFEKKRVINPDHLRRGIHLAVWGFFKKLVIADTVGIYADKVFAAREPSFLMVWAGVFAFTIQIYADFSAYSDIARGCARMLGFKLSRNFNHPFVARSPAEFWSRWHISLTSWLRDYVTVSLHRTRFFQNRRALNIMLTFALCGLWHGASWNFILWGLYSGSCFLLLPPVYVFARRILRGGFVPLERIISFAVINTHMLIFREREITHLLRLVVLNPFENSMVEMLAARQIFILTALFSLPLWLHAAYTALLSGKWGNAKCHRAVFDIAETFAVMLMFIGIVVLYSEKVVGFVYFQF